MVPTVLGVYASQKSQKVGAGSTRQDRDTIILWLVARMPGGDYASQPLNTHNLPSGFVQKLKEAEFLTDYELETGFFEEFLREPVNSLYAKLQGAKEPVATLEYDAQEKMLLDGLLAFVHGQAGRAPTAKDLESAVLMLTSLLDPADAVFEYQKTITGAAINLRKERNFDQAVAYYKKALGLGGQSDHILFNLARVYFEMGKIDEARIALHKALQINPDLEMAHRFLRYLDASKGS